MSDDFFDDIGKAVSQQASARADQVNRAAANREFQAQVVDRIAPIGREYAEKLRPKGINADFRKHALGLQFTMRYADGGHWSLDLGPSTSLQGLQFHSDFTNDDGRPCRTTDGVAYDAESWKDEIFEERLRDAIKDYVFYASRHGGVK